MKSKHALIAFLILILLGGGVLFFENPFSPPTTVSKKLFPDFSPDTLSLIRLEHQNQGIQFIKEEGLWRVGHFTAETEKGQIQPDPGQADTASYPADPDLVRRMLQAVAQIESNTAVSSNPEKYPLFHLNEWGTQVEMSGGTEKFGFILGKNGPDQGVFLRKTAPKEDPNVYFVSENLTPLFLKNLPEWRDKRLTRREASELQEMIIKHSRETLTFKRDSGKKWILEEKPNFPLETEAVESLARNLSHLTALTVGEQTSPQETGLDKPEAEVFLKFSGEGGELQLRLGKLKEADTFYASLKGLRNWENEIFTVSQALAEKLKAPLNKYLPGSQP